MEPTKLSNSQTYAQIANELWQIQNQLRLCVKFGDALPSNAFLYLNQDSPNFFGAVRRALVAKYGSSMTHREIRTGLSELTFDEFKHQLFLSSTPLEVAPEPRVQPEKDLSTILPTAMPTSGTLKEVVKKSIDILAPPGFASIQDLPMTAGLSPPLPVHRGLPPVENRENLPSEKLVNPSNVYDGFRCLVTPGASRVVDQHVIIDPPSRGLPGTEVMIAKRRTRLHKGRAFPMLVYAPPHSGKTTRQSVPLHVAGDSTSVFSDTDDLFTANWKPEFVTFTNMGNLLTSSGFSIAILPSRDVFNARCRIRGLDPPDDWYDGSIRTALQADIAVFSDAYLSDVI